MKNIQTLEDFRDIVAFLKANKSYVKKPRVIAGNFITKEKTVIGPKQFDGSVGDFNCFNVKNNQIDLNSEYFQKPDPLTKNWKDTGKEFCGLKIWETRPVRKVLLSADEWKEYYELFNRFVDPEWAALTAAGHAGKPLFLENATANSETKGDNLYDEVTKYVVVNFTETGLVTDVYCNDGPAYYFFDKTEEADYLERMEA